MKDDGQWMELAIKQAQYGFGLTAPNPAVGAVIVKEGLLLGAGWHHRAGRPHAEREAIADALSRYGAAQLRGSCIYVTLEPCSTFGRTPPCTQGIIEAGIKRVVYGTEDPNPAHAGAAKNRLQAAGVEVLSGIKNKDCQKLIRGFSKFQRTGLPWVLVKSAISLDGRITRPPGESQWLTSPESRQVVQRLRFESDAIITGGQTLRVDNPALTIRDSSFPAKKQPWRMVITRGQKDDLPSGLQVFTDNFSNRTLVQEHGDLLAALKQLANKGCQSVMVEAGGRLVSAFIEAGLVDELVVFYAPLLTGGADAGFAGLPQHLQLTDSQFSQVGDDVMMRALLENKKQP